MMFQHTIQERLVRACVSTRVVSLMRTNGKETDQIELTGPDPCIVMALLFKSGTKGKGPFLLRLLDASYVAL